MVEMPNAFGGFAPFPNTIMIPTMGLQSDVIGFRFGFGYEKGKRTLRAMSNEEFNTLDEEAEQAIYKRHDASAIHFFEMEIAKWTELQKIIIEKSVEIETMKAQRTPSALREIFDGFITGLAEQESGGIIPIKELKEWFWNTFLGGQVTLPPGTGQPRGEHEFLTSAEAAEHKAHGHLGGTGQPSPDKEPTAPPKPPTAPPKPVDVRKKLKKLPAFTDWSLAKDTIVFRTVRGQTMNREEFEGLVGQKMSLHKKMLNNSFTFSYSKFRNGQRALPKIQNAFLHFRRILANWNNLADVMGHENTSVGAIFTR